MSDDADRSPWPCFDAASDNRVSETGQQHSRGKAAAPGILASEAQHPLGPARNRVSKRVRASPDWLHPSCSAQTSEDWLVCAPKDCSWTTTWIGRRWKGWALF